MRKYIDLKWHTVPLLGKLERQEDGSKTIPQFEAGWRKRYSSEFNSDATALGGAITGKVSGIIAIDCDNELTWNLFRGLDPEYPFIFKSQGKGKECGTIIYKYTQELAQSFKINDNILALDFYSNDGFIYLATAANKTKVELKGPLPPLSEAPATVVTLLQRLKAPATVVAQKEVNTMTAPCLAPMVQKFCINKGKILPGLFKVLTPKDFRDVPEYTANGFLHPNKVPNGRGSEYLSKVSAILGKDISIDTELYCEAMHYINSLFDDPMDTNRLDSTVIDPMISGRAAIDGEPLWQYDEGWDNHRLLLHTKRNTTIDICFDDKRGVYYVVDEANQSYKAFNRDQELISFIQSTVINAPKKPEVTSKLSMINTMSLPHKEFGFHDSDDPTARVFNTFTQTPEMHVFTNPETYKKFYKRPETTLLYLNTLVPEVEMREYLVQFVRHKLKTFQYSPVVLYFLGVHGSGKDTFVQILERVLGHIARPSAKEFLEKHNGWILDSYFAQLDEYGNQLTRIAEKEDALGRLKAYTGKRDVQVRQMRTDGYIYKHNMTFIMTANKNPLMLEEGDRRIAFFNTPNVLAEQGWVLERGGVSEVYDAIMSETKDFMYWLATEVDEIAPIDYIKPRESETKHELIASSMFAANRIAYCFKHQMREHMLDLADEFNCIKLAREIKQGRVSLEALEELYMDMTEQKGDMRSLTKIIRSMGTEVHRTSVDGKHSNFVYI